MKFRILFFLVVTILFMGTPSRAILKIDFQKALELAEQNNKNLQYLKDESKYADFTVKEAYSAAMPVISAIGNYSNNLMIPVIQNDILMGDSTITFKMAMGRTHNFYYGASLQQPIWIAGKIGIGIKVAKIYRQVAELGVAQGECDLRLQVVQAFYGAILAKEYHQMMLDTKAQIESHLKNVQAMYEHGMVSEYDKLRAVVELANFSPQVTSAEEAWKMALEGLRMVLGLAPQDEFEPVGELAEITPKEVDINKAIDEAFSNRADYRQIGLRTQMLQQALKVEKRNQYWPSFFLSVNYQKQAQEKNLNFDEYFWGEGLSVGIACSIPLFDGFKTHNRIQMAKLNVHKAELMKSQAEDGIRIEIKQAVWKLEEASEKLQASQQAVQQAEKGYSIAEVRYQSGISTQVELLDARLSGTQAQISELSARYDLIVAKASLERAIGMKPLTH